MDGSPDPPPEDSGYPHATPEDVRELLNQLTNDEGELVRSPMGELLREHGHELPDNVRRAFAAAGGPALPLGSKLEEALDSDDLPEETTQVLQAANFLAGIPGVEVSGADDEGGVTPVDALKFLRHNLSTFATMLEDNWPAAQLLRYQDAIHAGADPGGLMEEVGSEDPTMEAVRVVFGRVDGYVRAIQAALEDIADAGLSYNWQRRRLEIPPGPKGGHPRRLLVDLVAALDQVKDSRLAPNDRDLQDWLARELAPYFTSDSLRPGRLKDAVDYARRSSR